ncbi:bifunctional apoptosis regulator isoform X1, partial [Tachysurus ichikawai]
CSPVEFLPVTAGCVGYRCGLPVWVTGVGYLCGLPVWVTGVGYRCGLPVWVTCVGYLCGLPVRVTCAGYLCGLPVRVTGAGYRCGLPVRVTCAGYLCGLPVRVTGAGYRCGLPVRITDVECEVLMSDPEIRTQSVTGESGVLECVLSCHCCYDVLVNPTTLTCGHSFCRHCLALWWESSHRTECPECREPWHGFPKVNILLRDAVEKLYGADVKRRCEEIQSNVSISRSLLAFQRFGDEQSNQRSVSGGAGSFCSVVFLTLSFIMNSLCCSKWPHSRDVDDIQSSAAEESHSSDTLYTQ